jgi:hypothetical protein
VQNGFSRPFLLGTMVSSGAWKKTWQKTP